MLFKEIAEIVTFDHISELVILSLDCIIINHGQLIPKIGINRYIMPKNSTLEACLQDIQRESIPSRVITHLDSLFGKQIMGPLLAELANTYYVGSSKENLEEFVTASPEILESAMADLFGRAGPVILSLVCKQICSQQGCQHRCSNLGEFIRHFEQAHSKEKTTDKTTR